MNNKIAQVLNGFFNLSETDKAKFIDELNTYQRSGYYEKRTFQENVQKGLSVGPKDSICQCCGR